MQSIIQKHNLLPEPIVVLIKPGGSGAEGYVYTRLGGALRRLDHFDPVQHPG